MADDMDTEGERRIAEYVQVETGHEFLFLTDYPASTRAFYHMRHPDRPELTRGFDLLRRGLEVTTGTQREHRYDRLKMQAAERGYDFGPLRGYLETFRYGCAPHGGFGLGLGRLLMRSLCAQGSVSDQARRLAIPRCGGYGRPREGVKRHALPEMPIDSVKERPERTEQGYRRLRCLDCRKQFNERSGGLLNRLSRLVSGYEGGVCQSARGL